MADARQAPYARKVILDSSFPAPSYKGMETSRSVTIVGTDVGRHRYFIPTDAVAAARASRNAFFRVFTTSDEGPRELTNFGGEVVVVSGREDSRRRDIEAGQELAEPVAVVIGVAADDEHRGLRGASDSLADRLAALAHGGRGNAAGVHDD
jgi:hypothetical protein